MFFHNIISKLIVLILMFIIIVYMVNKFFTAGTNKYENYASSDGGALIQLMAKGPQDYYLTGQTGPPLVYNYLPFFYGLPPFYTDTTYDESENRKGLSFSNFFGFTASFSSERFINTVSCTSSQYAIRRLTSSAVLCSYTGKRGNVVLNHNAKSVKNITS